MLDGLRREINHRAEVLPAASSWADIIWYLALETLFNAGKGASYAVGVIAIIKLVGGVC